jgi:hypothetical protein
MAGEQSPSDTHMSDADSKEATIICFDPTTLGFTPRNEVLDPITTQSCSQMSQILIDIMRPSDLSSLKPDEQLNFVSGMLLIPDAYRVERCASPSGVKRRAEDVLRRGWDSDHSDSEDDSFYESDDVVFTALDAQMSRLRTNGSQPVLLQNDRIVSDNLLRHERKAAQEGTPMTMTQLFEKLDGLSDPQQNETLPDDDTLMSEKACYFFDNGVLMLNSAAAEDKELQVLCKFGETVMTKSVMTMGVSGDEAQLTAAVTNALQQLALSVDAEKSLEGLHFRYGGSRL